MSEQQLGIGDEQFGEPGTPSDGRRPGPQVDLGEQPVKDRAVQLGHVVDVQRRRAGVQLPGDPTPQVSGLRGEPHGGFESVGARRVISLQVSSPSST